MTEKCDVLESQRAWVGHGEFHDDAPPRRLFPVATWEGEPFGEDTSNDFGRFDDWLYDDPHLRRVPTEDEDSVFDSREGVPS